MNDVFGTHLSVTGTTMNQECTVGVNGGELRFVVSTRETTGGHVGVVHIGGVEVYVTLIAFDSPGDAYFAARQRVIRKFAELTK